MVTVEYLEKHAPRLAGEFRLNGYVSIPGFYAGEALDRLIAAKDRYIREVVPTMPETQVYYEDKQDAVTLKQLQNIWEYDAFFEDMMTAGPLPTLARIVLGEAARPVNMQYFNKPPGVGQPTPPHQDGFYFHLTPNHAVTIWIALEDIEPEQGCVKYVQGSHRYGMRWHGRTKTLGFSQGMLDFGTEHDREHTVSFPCKAGHLIAHHSLTIHWADGNTTKDRTRQAFGAVYYADRCRVDEKIAAAYQAQLNAELAQAGKI